jgi:hypothetical protein
VYAAFFYFLMGCTDCWNKKDQDAQLQTMRTEAKKQAKEKGTPIAIVEDEEKYYLADAYYAAGNNLRIKEVVA